MTNRAVISQLSITGSATTHAKVSRLTITGSSSKKAKISRLTITGGGSTKKAKISRLTITGGLAPGGTTLRAKVSRLVMIAGTPVANAGGGRVVDPETIITVNPVGGTGLGDYSWVQVANSAPTVVLTPIGQGVQFRAPSKAAGCDVILRLTVASGATTVTDDATITVRPQLVWVSIGGVWVPKIQHQLPVV